jgi:hypothetical protein
VIDPSDPLHDSIEAEVAGLSGKEAVQRLMQMFPPKKLPPQKPPQTSGKAPQ